MAFDGEAAGEHSFDITVENRRALAESENGDRRRRRAADARQAGEQRRIVWKASGMIGDQHLRAALQMAGTRVITEPGPQSEDLVERRRRQMRQVGKMRQKAEVIRLHAAHLCLLQHDFRQPDAVGVAGVLPRQVVTATMALPVDHPLGKAERGVVILIAEASRCPPAQIGSRAKKYKYASRSGSLRLDSTGRRRDNPRFAWRWRINIF